MEDDPTLKVQMTFDGFSYKPREPCSCSDDVEETPTEREDLQHISSACVILDMVQDNVTSEFFLSRIKM